MSDMTIQPNEQVASAKPYISAEEYLGKYADKHYEWVNGEIFEMSPVSLIHELLIIYFKQLFTSYFALNPNPKGMIVGDPFTMHLANTPSYRQPDIQIILGDNLQNLTERGMMGASDICIEIVSFGSIVVDYDEKFAEYEQGGVKEYWIIDPKRRIANFHRLNTENSYEAQSVNEKSLYSTPILPFFALNTSVLWDNPLPNPIEILDMLRALKS
jgi:Uma2 family endonuclease